MNCFFHPGQPAAAACQGCGRPLCGACLRSALGRNICITCLAGESASGAMRSRSTTVQISQGVTVQAGLASPAGPARDEIAWLRELGSAFAGRRGSGAILGVLAGAGLAFAGLAGLVLLFVLMSQSPVPALLVGLFASLGALAAGAALASRGVGHLRQGERRELEVEVLRLAGQSGGEVTIPQVVLGTRLSVSEAESLLQSMAGSGHVVMDVDEETGAYKFVVPGLSRSVPGSGPTGGSIS